MSALGGHPAHVKIADNVIFPPHRITQRVRPRVAPEPVEYAYALRPSRRKTPPSARSVAGTVVGAILIGVLINGLVLMNVSPYVQQIIIGVIIVLAVAFDRFVKGRRRR